MQIEKIRINNQIRSFSGNSVCNKVIFIYYKLIFIVIIRMDISCTILFYRNRTQGDPAQFKSKKGLYENGCVQ